MTNETRLRVVFFRTESGREPMQEWLLELDEVRSQLDGNRIARLCFTVRAGEMALLHGFVKKSQKMPQQDLELARHRRNLGLNG